jgi:hypothetical protein
MAAVVLLSPATLPRPEDGRADEQSEDGDGQGPGVVKRLRRYIVDEVPIVPDLPSGGKGSVRTTGEFAGR